MKKIVIIGGGAAGLMAAVAAANEMGNTPYNITVVEKNSRPARKVMITGKGRCNVTNNCDVNSLIANTPKNGKFLYSAFNNFNSVDTMTFFESMGVPLKTERGNRVFPVSDNANDIAGLLVRLCERAKVKVLRTRAKDIVIEDGEVKAVITNEGRIDCRAVALCTGGLSYPLTGSDGVGYKLAKKAGHSITETRASLVPLESDDEYCSEMQGFALKNVTLSAYENGKLIFKELGEMLFTHFGVSGPLVLSASSHMRNMGKAEYRLEIDLKPALDEKKLDARILRDFEKYSNKEFKNALSELAGRTMIPVLIRLSGIPEDTKVHSITREQRMQLLKLFKAFPVSVSGTRPVAEAIITSGGVSTKEVNPRTMESKFVSGLFFAGEILDLDGYTGGFNLQIAWSTGFVAGKSVLKDEYYD